MATVILASLGISLWRAEAAVAPTTDLPPITAYEERYGWERYLLAVLEEYGVGEAYPIMKEIAMCESSGRTDVVSTTGDVGLFQINLAAHGGTVEYWQNYQNNVNMAVSLYVKNGLRDWYPYSGGCWGWVLTREARDDK